MKHVNFQLYRAHLNGIIWGKLTIDDKYINKRVWLFIHQAMFVSGIRRKKSYDDNEVNTLAHWLITFKKFVHEEKLKVVDKEFQCCKKKIGFFNLNIRGKWKCIPWKNEYPNLKTTFHIKPKFLLGTKLPRNLLLAKYLISVAAA